MITHTPFTCGPTKYCGENTTVAIGRYPDGHPLIILHDRQNYTALTATINLETKPPPGYVHIKDHGGNEGVADALVRAGIIELTGRSVPTDDAEAKLARVTDKVLACLD